MRALATGAGRGGSVRLPQRLHPLDGCVFVNRTDVHRPQPYEYLSYQFSNMFEGIVDLFLATCERVGVFTRVNQNARGLWSVRINRRASVALLLEHVGPKE